MTSQTPPPPAGWYTNQHGQQQWWDGARWGHIAGQPAPTPPPSYAQAAVTPAHAAYVQPGYPHPVVLQPAKSSGLAFLFWFLLGAFSAHRFYLGRIGSAVGFLCLWWIGWFLTLLYVGWLLVATGAIWLLVDLFLIPQMTREANARLGWQAAGAAQLPQRPYGTY